MPKTILAKLVWLGIAILGASAIGGIAIHRGESINAIWFIVAAACTYLVAFRFYSAWICAKVLVLDETRATPAERFNNGRDFVPTNRWVVFGHHFAAIAGPGPLIGPTLAMQFGYLPGTLWILAGAVFAGATVSVVRSNRGEDGTIAGWEVGPSGLTTIDLKVEHILPEERHCPLADCVINVEALTAFLGLEQAHGQGQTAHPAAHDVHMRVAPASWFPAREA